MKFKRIISSLFLFLSITLSSCSLFGGADEGLMIERVESTMGENGSTLVTMYFTDEDVEPLTFEIPRGETGEIGPVGATGLGIKEITSRQSEDGLNTILTIIFTSEDVPNQEITVPNGVSIVSPVSSYDPETNITTIYFILSDGTDTSANPIQIENGKDGIGIADINQETDAEGNIIITITYTDPSMGENGQTVITLPYKNGEDGRGIQAIIGTQSGDYYTITISFTDGTMTTLDPILLPSPTVWFSGYGAPTRINEAEANEGDYYFDLANYVIYLFDGTKFNEIIDLTEANQNSEFCSLTFYSNGGYFASDGTDNPRAVSVEYGKPILSSRIPLCVKDGFKFAGYYTSPEGPENPLSGKLTDLTPIYSDMSFYAYFTEI